MLVERNSIRCRNLFFRFVDDICVVVNHFILLMISCESYILSTRCLLDGTIACVGRTGTLDPWLYVIIIFGFSDLGMARVASRRSSETKNQNRFSSLRGRKNCAFILRSQRVHEFCIVTSPRRWGGGGGGWWRETTLLNQFITTKILFVNRNCSTNWRSKSHRRRLANRRRCRRLTMRTRCGTHWLHRSGNYIIIFLFICSKSRRITFFVRRCSDTNISKGNWVNETTKYLIRKKVIEQLAVPMQTTRKKQQQLITEIDLPSIVDSFGSLITDLISRRFFGRFFPLSQFVGVVAAVRRVARLVEASAV